MFVLENNFKIVYFGTINSKIRSYMNKKLAIFMVSGVVAISGFSGLIAGPKVYAVESSDMQSLKEEIASNKAKLENQIAFLKNLAIKADKYIKNESSISPSNQAQRYLEKLNKDDFYVLEYREAVMKEIEHINKSAEKKQGVYEQLPELKELQERIANAILALTDEGNFIAHIENRQKELLGEKDLNKAERNAKMLKGNINRYFNKLRAQYGNEFLLADRFKSSLIAGIDNVIDQINKKIEEEKMKAAEEELKKAAQEEADRLKKDEENNSDTWEKIANEKAAEEELKKAAQEEADRLKKDEENNSDAWEKIANEENKKNENKKQDEKLDEKQGQNLSEVKASELPENQISKKDNKQIRKLQAPDTGENQKQSFEITFIGVVSTILAAISVVVIKRQ